MAGFLDYSPNQGPASSSPAGSHDSARSAIVNALALSTRISAADAGLAKPMPSAITKLQTDVVVKGGKRMEPSIRR